MAYALKSHKALGSVTFDTPAVCTAIDMVPVSVTALLTSPAILCVTSVKALTPEVSTTLAVR